MPLEWYKDEEHIGYDRGGQRIVKAGKADKLDSLLARNDASQVIVFPHACSCLWYGRLMATHCSHSLEFCKQMVVLAACFCYCISCQFFKMATHTPARICCFSGARSTMSTTTRR